MAKKRTKINLSQPIQPRGGDLEQLFTTEGDAEQAAGLQLLAALSNMDHNWQLVGSSKNFTDACHAMGLVPWMDQHVPHANPTGVRA